MATTKRLWQQKPTDIKAQRLFTFFSHALTVGCDIDTAIVFSGIGLERMKFQSQTAMSGFLTRTKQQIEKGVRVCKQSANLRRLFILHLPFMRSGVEGLVLVPIRTDLNLLQETPWQVVADVLTDKRQDDKARLVKLLFDESVPVPDETQKKPNTKAIHPIEVHETYWLGAMPKDEHKVIMKFKYASDGNGKAWHCARQKANANSDKAVIYRVYNPNYRKGRYVGQDQHATTEYKRLYIPIAERLLSEAGFVKHEGINPPRTVQSTWWQHPTHTTRFHLQYNGLIHTRYTADDTGCDHCANTIRAIDSIAVRPSKRT